ncbi:sulfotransferase family protein [Bizionia sp. KMM 8389]
MSKIDFFCIGTQKGGTTTLHDILSQHPDLCLPEKKETHFFSDESLYLKGKDFYLKNFKARETAKFLGEVDPEYSYFKASAKRIFDTFGITKIVFIIRNPVERAYSQYLMTERRGLENLDFETALETESERIKTVSDAMHYSYLSRGYYINQLETFEAYFGADNIKIVLFEEFIKDTEGKVQEISDFIGLPSYNYITDKISNPAAKPRFLAIQKFIYGDNPVKKIIGKFLGSKDFKRKLMLSLESMNLKASKKEKLSADAKQKIYLKYYAKEVEALEKKLGLNLSIWKNY